MLRKISRLLGTDPQQSKGKTVPVWEFIGDNRNTAKIPQWVLDKFASIPGSHGTRLIDYPEPGGQLRFKGRTFRYRIDMGNQSWTVYRRLRRNAKRD